MNAEGAGGGKGSARKLNKQNAQVYCERTHFTLTQVLNLANIYKKLTKDQALDRQTFRDYLYRRFRLTDEFLLDRIFKVFDKDNDMRTSLDEWILGMSVFLLGTQTELIKFCFNVYNLTTDVSFGRDEMYQLLRKAITNFNTDDDPDEGVRDLIELVLRKMDHDEDGRINFEDFQASVKSDELYLEMFGNCLPAPEYISVFLEQLNTSVED